MEHAQSEFNRKVLYILNAIEQVDGFVEEPTAIIDLVLSFFLKVDVEDYSILDIIEEEEDGFDMNETSLVKFEDEAAVLVNDSLAWYDVVGQEILSFDKYGSVYIEFHKNNEILFDRVYEDNEILILLAILVSYVRYFFKHSVSLLAG